VEARPLDRLSIQARMENQTADPGVDTSTQQVLTELGLFGNFALRTRMDSTTRSDQPDATSLSQVQLRADQPKGGGVGLLVGATSWDAPGKPQTDGTDLRLTLGNEGKGLGAVSYQVTEYDPDKLTMYQDPLVRVSFSHARPQSLSLKLGLADQQGRTEPERDLEMGIPALGGAFTVAYAENPLDRQGKNVMLGNRWDATLTRKVMGDIDMKLKYRYYDLDAPLLDQEALTYMQVELAGGAENKGGKIALGFCQGDFVPQPDPKKSVPMSVLDLSYSRRWSDAGRFVVTVSHVLPAIDSKNQDPEMQGRLEYVTAW